MSTETVYEGRTDVFTGSYVPLPSFAATFIVAVPGFVPVRRLFFSIAAEPVPFCTLHKNVLSPAFSGRMLSEDNFSDLELKPQAAGQDDFILETAASLLDKLILFSIFFD